jgi:hypothetical protein
VKELFQMRAAEYEDVIQAFVADAAHPPLGDRVRLRRPHRRLDRAHTLAAHDLVERARKLRVPIVEEKADVLQPFLDREVARLLAHPDAIRVRGHARQPNPP